MQHAQFDVHVAGEGGEYETLVVDCPLFLTHRIHVCVLAGRRCKLRRYRYLRLAWPTLLAQMDTQGQIAGGARLGRQRRARGIPAAPTTGSRAQGSGYQRTLVVGWLAIVISSSNAVSANRSESPFAG